MSLPINQYALGTEKEWTIRDADGERKEKKEK
jgi:hypothetical protein